MRENRRQVPQRLLILNERVERFETQETECVRESVSNEPRSWS